MNEKGKQHNMISNLPLLFANGYPTSLEKITEKQLENFIPFMVQCSLGHINLPKKNYCSEPEWWPENIPFSIPLTKPKGIDNWMKNMKEIVVICYQFHKSVFLLRFCNDLASYEQASLRFINNYNSTTSLYDRRSNKLLVTFRNENMSYDQQQTTRKCLLQRKTKNGCDNIEDPQEIMVEPAPFDIYLCDNCDAELYSKEAIMEHEKTCNVDEADVILCDSPEPQMDVDNKKEDMELRKSFLMNFNLMSKDNVLPAPKQTTLAHNKDETSKVASERAKRLSRRNRATHSLTKCPSIPLSSPAGQQLLRTTKTGVTKDYLTERLDRIERFCHTSLILKAPFKSRTYEKRSSVSNFHCTFKKPAEYSNHVYVYPHRQFSQRRKTARNFLFMNSPLIKQCRPISVRIKKITENEISYQRNTNTNTICNENINIKLTRDTTHNSNWKIFPASEIIVDTIDLCSSDDDEEMGSNSNNDSRPFDSNKSSSNLPNHNSSKNENSYSTQMIGLSRIFKDSMDPGEHGIIIPCTDNSGARFLAPEQMQSEMISEETTTLNEGRSLMKPLRQSVYIFSNYKTDSSLNRFVVNTLPTRSISNSENTVNGISAVSAATTPAAAAAAHVHQGGVIGGEPKDYYDVVNCGSAPKSNRLSVSNWYTDATTNQNNKNSSINQSYTIDSENYSGVAHNFSSPGRIISIDLTT